MYVSNKAVTLRASSAVTVPTTEYGVFDTAKKTSTATATTTNKLVDSTGLFTTTDLIAVGDIVKNTTTGKFALVTAIDSATQLSLGADIMSSTNAYVIYPGLGYKLNANYKNLIAELNVTAAATDVGDTLDVYVDTSIDGGLTWFNIGHFTQVLGNGGAKKYIMALAEDNAGTSDVFEGSSDCASGVTRQIGFGDRIRYRAVTVDAGTQNESFTYSINVYLKA